MVRPRPTTFSHGWKVCKHRPYPIPQGMGIGPIPAPERGGNLLPMDRRKTLPRGVRAWALSWHAPARGEVYGQPFLREMRGVKPWQIVYTNLLKIQISELTEKTTAYNMD